MGRGAKANTMKLNRDKCEVLCLALVLDRPGLENTHLLVPSFCGSVAAISTKNAVWLLERVKCKDSELRVWGWLEVMRSQDKARNGCCERSEPTWLEDLWRKYILHLRSWKRLF